MHTELEATLLRTEGTVAILKTSDGQEVRFDAAHLPAMQPGEVARVRLLLASHLAAEKSEQAAAILTELLRP